MSLEDKLKQNNITNNICAIDNNNNDKSVCLPNDIILKITKTIIPNNKCNSTECINNNKNKIINDLTEELHCKDDKNKEICIINKITENDIITKENNNILKFKYFKPLAEIDPIKWLSNTEIDLIQEQLYKKYKNYYYSNIHMIDLVIINHDYSNLIDHPIINIKDIDFYKELNNINYNNKISIDGNNLKSYGVVVNTDPSTKGGQHWFAIFMNFNTNGSIKDPYTIEYFNSSGHSIQNKQFKQFFIDLALNLSNKLNKCVNFIQVTNIQHQGLDPVIGENSGNCGVYSMYYIWSRLENIPYTYFNQKQRIITDNVITKIREGIFRIVE
jgi:hypothetical protein